MLFQSMSLHAQEWRKTILEKLPSPLKQFEIGKTKLADVTKTLRVADLIEGDKHYFEFQDFKYALQLIYKDDVLISINFTFQQQKPDLAELSKFLENNKLKSHPESGAAAGRYLKAEHEKGKLIIDPLTKKIYSVELK